VFGDTSTAPAVALQAVVVAAGFLYLGYLVADALLGRRVDAMTKLGLALPGVVALALLAQGVHVISGGRLFESAVATRVFVIVIFVALLLVQVLVRPAPVRSDRALLLVAIGMALLGVVVWGYPLLHKLPLGAGGDVVLHTGYSAQLLNGESLPTTAVTGSVPNFYPWMTHSVMALFAHFMPGSRTYNALAPLQIIQVAGVILALAALGAQLASGLLRRTTTAAATALLGAICGGIGFLALRGIDVIHDPRVEDPERYLGDLLERRSYNFSFFNLAPSYPRDLAAALLVGFLVALVFGLARKHTRSLIGAGVVLGLAGVTGGEAFFVGVGVVIVLLVIPNGASRAQILLTLVAALALYSLWLVPQLISFIDLGGFVNLTLIGPVQLTVVGVLGGWGITVPLAIYGAFRNRSAVRGDAAMRVLVVLVGVALAMVIASSILPALLGEGFETLSRAHRYWPLLHLGIAIVAAVGLADLLTRVSRHRVALVGLALLVTAVAIASPIEATLTYSRRAPPRFDLVGSALRGEPSALLNLIAPETGMRCSVAVPATIDGEISSYTGYRLVLWIHSVRSQNLARIRWRDIYERIPGDKERVEANRILLSGTDPEQWQATVDRFDVDIIVTSPDYAGGPAMARVGGELAAELPLVVVRVDDCD
jgi:hypothetical protein